MKISYAYLIAFFVSATLVGCGSSSNTDQNKASSTVQVINSTSYNISAVSVRDSATGQDLFSSEFKCAQFKTDCYLQYTGNVVSTSADFVFYNEKNNVVAAYIFNGKIDNSPVDIQLNSVMTGLYLVNQLEKKYPEYAALNQVSEDEKILAALAPFVSSSPVDASVLVVTSKAYASMVDSNITPEKFIENLNNLIVSGGVIESPSQSNAIPVTVLAQTSGGNSPCSSGFLSLLEIVTQGVKFFDSAIPGSKQIGVVLDNISKNACASSGSDQPSNKILKEQLDQMNAVLKSMNGILGKFTLVYSDHSKWANYYEYDKIETELDGIENDILKLKAVATSKTLLSYVQDVGGAGPDGLKNAINSASGIGSLSYIFSNVVASNKDSMRNRILNLSASNVDDLIEQLNLICENKDSTIGGDVLVTRQNCNLTVLTIIARTLSIQRRMLAITDDVYSVLSNPNYRTVAPQFSYDPNLSQAANLDSITGAFKSSQETLVSKFKSKIKSQLIGENNSPTGLYNVYAQLPAYLLNNYQALGCYNYKYDSTLTNLIIYPSITQWIKDSDSNEYLDWTCFVSGQSRFVKAKSIYTIKNGSGDDYTTPPDLINAWGVLIKKQIPWNSTVKPYRLEESTGALAIPRFTSNLDGKTNAFFVPEFQSVLGENYANNTIQQGGQFGFYFKDQILSDNLNESYIKYVDDAGYSHVFILIRNNFQDSNYKNKSSFGLGCLTKSCSLDMNKGGVTDSYFKIVPDINITFSHLGTPWYFTVNGVPQTQ